MKNIFKYISLALAIAVIFISCQKAEELPYYDSGVGSELSLSTKTVTLSTANANQNVVTFNWTNPQFATDTTNYKYVIEIAPKGTNFANPVIFTQKGGSALSVSGLQLNNMLVAWGIPFATPTDLDVRLKSSYANNNDMKISPVTNLTVSSYAVPFTLSASSTGTFAPVVQTKDNLFAKLSWSVPDYGSSTVGYTLQYALAGTNFTNATSIGIAPDSLSRSLTGMELYQMANTAGISLSTTGSVDVRIKATVNGTNQVSYSNIVTLKITPVEMILYMYLPGDYQQFDPYKALLPSGNTWGWDPATSPKIASSDGVNYEGYVWVPAGGSGEFKMTSAPDWDHTNYGGTATTLDPAAGNLKWPATGKYYWVKTNMTSKTWSATEITTWGLIGDATPGSWDNSTPLIYNSSTSKWSATVIFKAGQFKFRANNGWDINLGSQGGDGTSITPLKYGGGNLPAPSAGTHVITLDLSNPLKYTYTIQ